MRKRLSISDYFKGLKKGNRSVLSKAITLIESELPADNDSARKLLEKIMPLTGNSIRIGITGVPGAGKSTFIEALGSYLTSKGKKVAVLAIDPSSTRTQGSILGDKTRMEELSKDPNAYIRPSPTGKSKSGITRRTRESILLCEAAGHEIILVETVGVGQIETEVSDMVDFFLLLIITGAGDELQTLKKGVMELADLIVINKADGSNAEKAQKLKSEIEKVTDIFPAAPSGWKTPVRTASSLNKTGISDVWELVSRYQKEAEKTGYFQENRKHQSLRWMKQTIAELLEHNFYSVVKKKGLKDVENKVLKGKIPPINAAGELYKIFKKSR